jgi:hypothetical protein
MSEKTYLTLELIESMDQLDRLKTIFDQCIITISKDKLYEHQTAKPYRQEALAQYIGTTYRKISAGRNQPNKVGIAGYQLLFRKLLHHFKFLIDGDYHITSPQAVPQNHLDELAGKLALNLIDISTSFNERIISYDSILADPILRARRTSAERVQRERYIAIVGAGASNAATYHNTPIPTTQEAIRQLYDAFKGKVDADLIRAEVRRLSNQMGREEEDFETQLLAFNKFSTAIVGEKLKEICGNANAPCLAYEIMAHLLKHRFLDVIINFNYDELLDNAIREELPDDNDYRFIYTAGHCPVDLDELRIDKRIKQPIYIKCHGTISQPNSLRFTERKAFIIEEAIQQHIADLFRGEVSATYKKEQLPLNLLIFGFGMDNHVFNRIIKKTLQETKQTITLWVFDTNPGLEKKIKLQFSELDAEDRERLSVKMILLPGPAAMNTELIHLWEKITAIFKKPYRPRGIARHQFIYHIFQHISPLDIGPGSAKNNARQAYYRDRLYVELFLLILKSNGIIHLSQIPSSRVGKYLNLLRNQEGLSESIHYYLEKMGMRVYEKFMYDTYLIRKTEAFVEKDQLIEILRKRLIKQLSHPAGESVVRGEKEFNDLAESFRQRRLLKVNPKYVNMHDNLFSELRESDVMNTSFAWIYNYRQNIEQRLDEWDLMLTISEEGSFLYEDAAKGRFADKFMEVVLATYGMAGASHKPRQNLERLPLLSGQLHYRPWWLHNKHLVLFLKRRNTPYTGNWSEDWELKEGFFYRQNMLSQRVNPVKLTHHADLKKLLYIFAIYWHGAHNDPKEFAGEEVKMNIVANENQLADVIKRLLGLYEEKRNPRKTGGA